MSGFVTPDTPNLPDFLTFLGNSVQIPSVALPSNSAWPGYALNQAIGLTLAPPSLPAPIMYTLAVYNCATHVLFQITPDQTGQTYFTNARSAAGYGLIQPSTGLIVGAADQGTSGNMAVPEWASKLTVGQLDFFKTPWGRAYLAWTQSYGPNVWGIT
ncbi:MAG TPA: hypothetical protein VMV54_02395 [Acidocella sp.]|nr:hypothetical protein [Acidocella sp.]